MSIISVATQQLQSIVDDNAAKARALFQPKQGWIRLTRQSLSMSGAQLARRMGVSRGLVSSTEKREIEGRVTLNKMQEFAQAMECRFVYSLVPNDKINNILKQQAKHKARAIVGRTNTHMALEDQALSAKQIEFEIERLSTNMLNEKISELWND